MRFAWLSVAGLWFTGLALAALLWPGFSLAGLPTQGNQERTKLPMQETKSSAGVQIPPMDAANPALTETATFALG